MGINAYGYDYTVSSHMGFRAGPAGTQHLSQPPVSCLPACLPACLLNNTGCVAGGHGWSLYTAWIQPVFCIGRIPPLPPWLSAWLCSVQCHGEVVCVCVSVCGVNP